MLLALIFVVVVVFAVRKGLEIISRVAELTFSLVVLFLITLFLLVFPNADFHFLRPILETGIRPVVKGTIDTLSSPFFEMVTLLVFYSAVREKEIKHRFFYAGVLLGGGILVVLTLMSVAILGVEQVSQTIYPSYTIAKTINLGEFFNRVESLVSISWLVAQVIYGAISFYAALYTLSRIFHLSTYRFLTGPLAILCLVISSYFMEGRNVEQLNNWVYVSFVFAVGYPLVLWIVSYYRKTSTS